MYSILIMEGVKKILIISIQFGGSFHIGLGWNGSSMREKNNHIFNFLLLKMHYFAIYTDIEVVY